MPEYWKFRYNFEPNHDMNDLEKTRLIIYNITVAVFTEETDLREGILGVHLTNSFGVEVRPHFHIHFFGDIKEKTFRDRFTKFCQKMDDTRKGQSLYGLKKISEDDLQDINKFYRYPLKEKNIYEPLMDKFYEGRGPKEFDYENQKLIAQSTRDALVESNQKFAIKEKDKNSTYDKLKKFLDEEKHTELRDLYKDVIKFYTSNSLACNFGTMKGYINTYRLQNGLMSEAEAFAYLDKY